MFPSNGVDYLTPRFPPPGPRGCEFPGFHGTIRALRLPAARPAALRCLRLAVPREHSLFRSRAAECCRRRAWSWSPGISGRELLPWRRQDLPRSWGTPLCPCPALRPRQDRRVRPLRHAGAAPALTTTKAPAFATFEAQSHGFGTGCLRFAGRVTPPPRKTRFRLLARLYRTGLATRRVPSKGFKAVSLHLILLSQACLCNVKKPSKSV